jgi:dsDNA-binding SOS-regulon protein
MAVIVKYVVVRNGVELDKEFLVKKEADAYDKMLDAADNLAAFIKEGDLDVGLDGSAIEAISVFLAKNGPEVTRILKGLKPITPAAVPPAEKDKPQLPPAETKKKATTAKAKGK